MTCPSGPTDYFYRHFVPKDPLRNIRWRKKVTQTALADREFADGIWGMCARDMLFYINTFGWLLEPRDRAPWQATNAFGNLKVIPFITRPYQDDAFLRMQATLGKKDILGLKSREMGFTWMMLYLFDHSWRFEEQMHYGLVSKDEDSVDRMGDPSSLMVKLDFLDSHLPSFLQPGGNSKKFRNRNRSDHTIENLKTGSTISGYACTGNIDRGGRKRAFGMDEMHFWPAESDRAAMASTQHVTQCRIMVSSCNGQRGQAGQFFEIATDVDREVERISLHWSADPEKAAGLYQANRDNGEIEIFDAMYPYTDDYPFVRDGKKRSPYYDYECRRPGATDRSIASELDMDFGGATSRFFDPAVIAIGRSKCEAPTFLAKLRRQHGMYIPELYEDPKGDIEIWIPPDVEYRMENDRLIVPDERTYAMGCDISRGVAGISSSYSDASIIDRLTGVQVAEWRGIRTTPPEMAELTAALGRVFNGATICPEATGPGTEYITKLIEIGYPYLWLRPKSKGAVYSEVSLRPGYNNQDGGLEALGELQHAMGMGKVTPRSHRIIVECERYFINEDGKLKHPLVGKNRVDAPERSHGDSAIAFAMAWWSIHEVGESAYEEVEERIALDGMCVASRQMLRKEKQRQGPAYWDERWDSSGAEPEFAVHGELNFDGDFES